MNDFDNLCVYCSIAMRVKHSCVLVLSAMAPIRSLLSFHHHRYRVGEEEQHHHHNGLGQVKEENARKRPKPLPTNAENIRCVTLSDFGKYEMHIECCLYTLAYIHTYMAYIAM